MANTLANADRCPGCGGLYAMIGRVHRCPGRIPQPVQITQETKAAPVGSSTYKHRDPEVRREYMRKLMRAKRALAKSAQV